MSSLPAPSVALSRVMVPQLARILAADEEIPGTVTLRLDASRFPGSGAFRPGQFHMLYAFGLGEVPISCSGDPTTHGELRHTIRAVGTVTRALCELPVGATVGVRGPFGTAWPLEDAKGQDVLLVAGGLGLAPLRSALSQILSQRASYGRVILVYGARSPEDLLFAADRVAWGARPDLELGVTVDHAGPGWTGPVGVVPALLTGLRLDPDRCKALICGPEVMMRFTVRELERLGLSAERIFVSMERNMKCATGLCGHCQFGPFFVCKDGPVFRFDRVARLFYVREV